MVLKFIIYRLKTLLKSTVAECRISDEQIESIVKCVLDDISTFFASKEGRKEFEAWKIEQSKVKASA